MGEYTKNRLKNASQLTFEDQKERILKRMMSKIKVVDNGCWEWTGNKNQNNYGVMGVSSIDGLKQYKAHRLMYKIKNGDISNNFLVCHKCDNPSCCNPDHLFLGTYLDNINDRILKGRTVKGENQGSSKLRSEQINEIRNKYIPKKYTLKRLAKEYGVHHSTIYNVVKRVKWKHI